MKSKRLVGIVIVLALLIMPLLVKADREGDYGWTADTGCGWTTRGRAKVVDSEIDTYGEFNPRDFCGADILCQCVALGFGCRWRIMVESEIYEKRLSEKELSDILTTSTKCKDYETCGEIVEGKAGCYFDDGGDEGGDDKKFDWKEESDVTSVFYETNLDTETHLQGEEEAITLFELLKREEKLEQVDLSYLAATEGDVLKKLVSDEDMFKMVDLRGDALEECHIIKPALMCREGEDNELYFTDLNQFKGSELNIHPDGFGETSDDGLDIKVTGTFHIVEKHEDGSYILNNLGNLYFIDEEGETLDTFQGEVEIYLTEDGINIVGLKGNAKFVDNFKNEYSTLGGTVEAEVDLTTGEISEVTLTGNAAFEPNLEDLGEAFAGEGDNPIGTRVRIENKEGTTATIHYNADGTFSYVEGLKGDYMLLDENGKPTTIISSINDDEPLVIYNYFGNDDDPEGTDSFKKILDSYNGDFTKLRIAEENLIYASVDQNGIVGTGNFNLSREGDEEHTSLDVESSTDGLFYYLKTNDVDGNNVEQISALGKVLVKDNDDVYEGYYDVTRYTRVSYDSSETIDIGLDGSYLTEKDEEIASYSGEELAYYGKRVFDKNGRPISIDGVDELVVGHNIGLNEDGSNYFRMEDESYNALADYIGEGNDIYMGKITNITTFGGNEAGGGEFVINAEGLNEVYTGSNGNELKVISPKGIKFKVCAELGEPCDYLTCCESAGSCKGTDSESIGSGLAAYSIGSSINYKTCTITDKDREENPELFDADGNLISGGDAYAGGDAIVGGEEIMEECVPMECYPGEEWSPEECMCIAVECEPGFENDYRTGECVPIECDPGEEYSYEKERCMPIECEPGEELDRYSGRCEPIECPEGEEYDVEEERCIPIREMPVLELFLNDKNEDLVLEEEDDKTVTIRGSVVEGDYDARVSIKIDGDEIRSGRDEIETTHTFAEEGRYSISFEYPESERFLTDSVRHQVIVKGTDEGPVWLEHGSDPISDSAYSESQEYEFWIKWQDASGIKKVEFENDFSGTTSKQTITEEGGKYTYTTIGIEIGTYNYKWFATNNEDITSSTDVILYKVGKGEPDITVTINGEVVEEVIQMYKQTEEATITIVLNEPDEADMIIKLDGQTQGGTEFVAPLDQFGYYALSVKVLETPSYTSKEFIKYINITQLDPDVLIKINDISDQEIVEVTDPDVEFNITLLEPEEGSVSFYIDNEPIQVIDDTIDYSFKLIRSLELGEHEIKATFDGTEVYRELSFVKTVNVVEP